MESPRSVRRRGKAAATRGPRPWKQAALIAVALSPLGGCCGVYGWLCGPDTSRWVARDYRTTTSAIETFLEAVRRKDTTTIAQSLSEDAKRHYGLTGVLETTLAWEHLSREVPGLHVLGHAKVVEVALQGTDRCRATLDVAGRRFTLDLVEQPFWVVYYTLPDEPRPERQGRYITAREFHRLLVVGGDMETTVDVRLQDSSLPTLVPEQIREVRIGHDWKVDRLDQVAPN